MGRIDLNQFVQHPEERQLMALRQDIGMRRGLAAEESAPSHLRSRRIGGDAADAVRCNLPCLHRRSIAEQESRHDGNEDDGQKDVGNQILCTHH
ncbi:hypothetical protein [Noviherbaspirillum humi]|uniref:hypothetical protein n=1 Tax=Noviherbaspirillum humi TaxID=1688639 RepID=UPI001160D6F0|nr:hypothetical protein [Noviherbaspirillum humi]